MMQKKFRKHPCKLVLGIVVNVAGLYALFDQFIFVL